MRPQHDNQTAQAIANAARHAGGVIDHDIIRRITPRQKNLPKVQAYYAGESQPAPEIVARFTKAGASFDVRRCRSSCSFTKTSSVPRRRSRILSGTNHLRQPTSRRNASVARPIQAARHYTRERAEENQAFAPHAAGAAFALPNTGSWWNCRPSSVATRAKRWIYCRRVSDGLVVEGLNFPSAASARTFRISCRR